MAETVPERLTAFRRTFRPLERAPSGLLGVAPWVDFALLLMMLFVYQSATALRPGVRLELPPAPFRDGIRPDALVLTVTQEGMYFFQDERMTLDGLQLALSRAARTYGEEAALIIEADQRITHGTLTVLYNMAHTAGFREIVLASRLEMRP
jgi:biopolymer transport protein ExbD